MSKDKYNILKDIYNELLTERKKENEKLQSNLDRIKEIDVYLKSVRDDTDFVVFSPRSAENIFSDRIRECGNEKSEKQEENKKYYSKLNKLDIQINQLKKLLEDGDDYFNQLEVLNIQEKERQRIATELHDSPVQNLTHLVHMIELSSMFIDQDPVRAKLELENCIKILKSTIDEMRESIFNLRPMSIDDLGFKQCVENFISNSQMQFKNCKIEYDICEFFSDNLNGKDKQKINLLLITIYRIIQEALINALKHSDAEKINLDVKENAGKCYINIKDNGKGFLLDDIKKQENKHFGLFIMKERINLLHGSILINTAIGKGTEIKIEIPLE